MFRKLSPGSFLFLNLCVASVFLAMQVASGLGPGMVHVDEQTYLRATSEFCYSFNRPLDAVGALYYCVVAWSNYNLSIIVSINLFFYFATSFLLYKSLYEGFKSKVSYIIFCIIIFDPYRLHLATHILKDTFIIFGLALSVKYLLFGLFISTWFRFFSIIYVFSIFNARSSIFLGVISVPLAYVIYPGIFVYLLNGGNADMVFRDFDQIPTFNAYGLAGDILRAIVWPFLFVTGIFITLSPSIWFAPIAFSMVILMVLVRRERAKVSSFVGIYISISVLAFITPGFTSFVRYAYPVVVIAPLLLISGDKKYCHDIFEIIYKIIYFIFAIEKKNRSYKSV